MKQKYPNYYLWTCEIFSSDTYKEFDGQVLVAVAENEQAFSTSQMVQAVLQDLVSSIATGFGALASKLQVLQSSQEDSNKKMNEHFAKFFALGNACFNGSSSSSVPSSLPSSLVSPATIGPQYVLCRPKIARSSENDVNLAGIPSNVATPEQIRIQ